MGRHPPPQWDLSERIPGRTGRPGGLHLNRSLRAPSGTGADATWREMVYKAGQPPGVLEPSLYRVREPSYGAPRRLFLLGTYRLQSHMRYAIRPVQHRWGFRPNKGGNRNRVRLRRVSGGFNHPQKTEQTSAHQSLLLRERNHHAGRSSQLLASNRHAFRTRGTGEI